MSRRRPSISATWSGVPMSWPAEKASPAPERTITRTSGSAAASAKAVSSSRRRVADWALRYWGRAMTTRATRSATAYSTLASFMSPSPSRRWLRYRPMSTGPLGGLRVLELATGVAGPYAGRLLAELGATVVKREPDGGDPCRRLAVDDGPPLEPSALFVNLNVGKRMVSSAVPLGGALAWADVVIVDRSVETGELDGAGTLVVRVVASEGEDWDPGDDDPRWELLAQAASGLMVANAEDGREPLRFPGWQSQYLAGAYAAAGALAGLAAGARQVETTCVGAALTGVEGAAATYLNSASAPKVSEEGEARQAGFQARAFPAGAFACADGYVIPGTVRPEDWALQCKVYGRPELADDERFGWYTRWENRQALMDEIGPWYAARTKREIFEAALAHGWAAGMVMTGADALSDPHLSERGFLGRVTGGGADGAMVPVRPWRAPGLAHAGTVRLGGAGEDDGWFEPSTPKAEPAPAPPPPDRLKVVELTWAWAGPFVGRFLGALGADVVRIETGSRPDGWRTRLRWRDIGSEVPDGVDPDSYTWDAAALFNTLGRNKRSLSVDLTHDRGRQLFVDMISRADLLVVNMTYRVLADRGVEDDVRRLIGSGLVVLNMPALGTSGPYRDMPGYGMLTEGMGGMAAGAGYDDEGARASTTYYPDAVAGVHGVVAALSALADRARSGRGCWVDFSQQEVLWQHYGEAIVMASAQGRED